MRVNTRAARPIARETNSGVARAVAFGASTALLGFVVFTAIGGLIGWFAPGWSSYRVVAEIGLVSVTVSAVLASGIGGGVAGRMAKDASPSIKPGLLVALVTIVIMVGTLTVLTIRYGDLRSLGIELGLIDIPDIDPINVPSFDAEGDPTITGSDREYVVLLETVLFFLALGGLMLGSAALGALVARRSPHDVGDDSHILES